MALDEISRHQRACAAHAVRLRGLDLVQRGGLRVKLPGPDQALLQRATPPVGHGHAVRHLHFSCKLPSAAHALCFGDSTCTRTLAIALEQTRYQTPLELSVRRWVCRVLHVRTLAMSAGIKLVLAQVPVVLVQLTSHKQAVLNTGNKMGLPGPVSCSVSLPVSVLRMPELGPCRHSEGAEPC